jgi:signal transduction histidine kinase
LYVSLALALTQLIWLFIKSFASPLFLLAIAITAFNKGIKAGIFATIASGILIDYFFISPEYQLGGSADDFLRLLIFGVEGYALCWLIDWRTKAVQEIKDSREQLQALSFRQQTLIESERKRIALEIHDELGQSLTSLKMEMHFLNQQVKEIDSPTKSFEVNERIEDLSHQIDATIQTVRRIATDLRPPILDDLGLVAAIEWQTQEFERLTGISCILSANVENIEINSEFTIAIFRIFQEALTNITRHAKANTISIDLSKLDQKLILRVEDDGEGISSDGKSNKHPLGILGMRERARLIGGKLDVIKGPENGTIVLLTAPIN